MYIYNIFKRVYFTHKQEFTSLEMESGKETSRNKQTIAR